MYSLGFDMVEPSFSGWNGGCGNAVWVDSTFTVTLLNSASAAVGTFTFNAPNDVAAFIGVSSTVPFSTVQVHETTGGIKNEYFGPVYTSAAATLAVPEPGTNALLLAGVAAMGAVVCRRRQR